MYVDRSWLSRTLALAIAIVALGSMTRDAAAERFTFHHEHVLGTSLEIQLEAANAEAAAKAEKRILDEIARMSKIVSSYDSTSELSRWQAKPNIATELSGELCEILVKCDQWRDRSRGAFNPAVEELTQLWQSAEKSGAAPSEESIAAMVKKISLRQWTVDARKRTASLHGEGRLSLNAIAKGSIIDRASQAALAEDVTGALVCIGGDMKVAGDLVQPVHVADPFHDGVNEASIATVYLRGRGLATSGGYRRGFTVAGKRYSHLFDPRSGKPVSHIASATVVANSAEDADALATIASVLTPQESLELVKSLPGVEVLMVTADGKQIASEGWSELTEPQLYRFTSAAFQEAAAKQETPKTVAAPADDKKTELLELVVNFELDKPAGAQYRRPYLAVWLEDADEFPVRTAVLWMQTKQPGPRWHRDLLRWYRNEGIRKLADKQDLIGTVSSATRGPGQYKAVFDGKDDAGKPLPPGKYTLFIEVAREHGTYQLIRQTLELGAEPIKEAKLKSNVEIKSATYEYRAPVKETQPSK